MLINVPEEVSNNWEMQRHPFSVKESYYFDTIEEEGKITILQIKTDNIDTYAVRLNNIIETVKAKTGKQKVMVVSHSMGGLVFRRYVQIFGEDSVEKAILIASPNNGINQEVLNYCKLFGEEKECNDMDEDSVLINKLKNQKKPGIPIYNIIGIGCSTYGDNGDGVVQNKSAYLSWAENYYIGGNCVNLNYLHTDIVKPEKYPETVNILKRILTQSNITKV